MAEVPTGDKDARKTSPPEPAVPPPSRTMLEYDSLGTTPAGGRDNYFPEVSSSTTAALPQASPLEDPNLAASGPVQPKPSLEERIKSNTSKLDQRQNDIQAPGATERLRTKLAEHRNSMSAAYEDEHPSRARDFAFKSSSTPPPARGATMDQAALRTLQKRTEPVAKQDGGQPLLQKSHSIMAPERHTASPTAPSPSVPIPSASNSPVPEASTSAMPDNRLQEAVVDRDPSATKAPAQAGLPASREELEEAIENPKKPFFKRAFGTRRKLMGDMPSQTGSATAGSPFAPTLRPKLSTNATGTASTTARQGNRDAPPGSFSLGGQRHKPSMARQRTKAAVPVGVAIPNTQRRREPTWSKKARERPLYSLGKPLPTHEEVQAQRAWQEQMERIKEMYPDAEPPEPPPLPSQQASAALAGGLQIDKAQLKDIIRTAIIEYKQYENGQLDLDAISAKTPSMSFGEQTSRRARRSTANQSSMASSSRRRFPSVTMGARNFGLPRMDSLVVDEEDGPPLEPLHTARRSTHTQDTGRKLSKAGSIGPGPPAVASRPQHGPGKLASFSHDGNAVSRNEHSSKNDEEGAGIPAFAEDPEREGNPVQEKGDGSGNASIDGGHSVAGSTILSRDHETQGNWSEEEDTEMDPEEAVSQDRESAECDHFVDEEDEDDDEYPNIVAKWRVYAREPFAEFLGAFVLAIIGIGASAQAALSSDPNIQPSGTGSSSTAVNLSAPLAWGAGVAMSVYIAGGISGGHISPAITIVLAVFRGFRQLLGFIAGSGVAYGLYRHAITIYEGGPGIRTIGVRGTASFFATYPMDYVSNANAFFQEFTNVAILLILILAIGDADNVPPPAGLNPIIIMFMIMAIGLSLGLQSSYCLNPARDLGPRLVSWWAGYGTDVWNYRDQYWLWCPWVADITGGLFGAFLYDTLIFMGRESPMNKRWRMPGISRFAATEEMSRNWQGWKLHQKARRAGWRSRLHTSKEPSAMPEKIV